MKRWNFPSITYGTSRRGNAGLRNTRVRAGAIALISLITLVLIACDLAMYDEESIEGARRSEEFEFLARREYQGWDFYSDDSGLIVPQGFYPDAFDSTTGYVLYESDQEYRVWRLDSDGIIGEVQYGYGSSTVHSDVDAWIVPIDPTVSNPAGYRPLFLVGQWYDNRTVELRAIGYDPGTGGLVDRSIDLSAQAQVVEPTTEEVISVNVVSYGPSSVRGGSAPFSTVAGSELQLLVRLTGGSAKELVFRGTGVDFVDWALGNPSAIVSAQGTISNQFPLPTRSDGDLPVGIRHATDYSGLTGILMFHDGDYSAAPIRVYTWDSDAVAQVPTISSWAGRVSSISYGGVLRTGRRGTFYQVTSFETNPAASREENGSMWYAGQYRRSTSMVDIYTQTGVVESFGDAVITVAVYRD
jgi:hypothetical protein